MQTLYNWRVLACQLLDSSVYTFSSYRQHCNNGHWPLTSLLLYCVLCEPGLSNKIRWKEQTSSLFGSASQWTSLNTYCKYKAVSHNTAVVTSRGLDWLTLARSYVGYIGMLTGSPEEWFRSDVVDQSKNFD